MKIGRMTRKTSVGKIRKQTKRLILFAITFIITFAVIATGEVPKKYDLQVGDIAPNDIKATRDTVDETATEERVNEAISKVEKQFTLKTDVQNEAKTNIRGLFEKVQSVKVSQLEMPEKIESIKNYDGFNLSSKDAENLLNLSDADISKILANISTILEKAYENNIVDNDERSLESAQNSANNAIEQLSLNETVTNILKYVFHEEIKPNKFYDEEKTQALKNEVRKNTENVVIKKNQTVVKEGDPVTESQLQVLKELGVLNENSGKGMRILLISIFILTAIILFIQNYYIYKIHKHVYNEFKQLLLINLLNCSAIAIARIISIGTPYLIPLSFIPMIITLLVNYKISLFTSVVNVVLICVVSQFNPSIIIVALINAVLGATMLKKAQQRNDIMYAALYIMVIVAVIEFSTGVILSSDLKGTLINTLYTLVGSFISGILAIGLLPFLEGVFDIVTTLKLLELSNPNSPLLRKLLMEAPGTYHHSMLVANIAEMAAEEVKADPVVTRIGAYYHDIGKTKRPYFFKENQLSNENPHDKINPALSASIIIAHAKDGLELAKEYKLPKVIQDMIIQHHGTTLVKYFYYTLKNSLEENEEIDEKDFRYPGPKPSTKEAAILMLADSVEAAVRSINEPTKEKIEEMVNNIIKDKLNSGQLDECDLTLKDLGKIRVCFLTALNGIYHQRIEYPTEKRK
ncbi:MAG: HDIG domain-containing protein [Clostridiaceae bacterium]|nr:HDIG domain-containing protein [Clostridiaceae bacterium]